MKIGRSMPRLALIALVALVVTSAVSGAYAVPPKNLHASRSL
jgi:hypothetical protein